MLQTESGIMWLLRLGPCAHRQLAPSLPRHKKQLLTGVQKEALSRDQMASDWGMEKEGARIKHALLTFSQL